MPRKRVGVERRLPALLAVGEDGGAVEIAEDLLLRHALRLGRRQRLALGDALGPQLRRPTLSSAKSSVVTGSLRRRSMRT